MAKSRKKVFPKPPVKFHSKLETELGRWSNKNGFEASVKGIYTQEIQDKKPILNDRQIKQLDKLKANLSKREYDKIKARITK